MLAQSCTLWSSWRTDMCVSTFSAWTCLCIFFICAAIGAAIFHRYVSYIHVYISMHRALSLYSLVTAAVLTSMFCLKMIASSLTCRRSNENSHSGQKWYLCWLQLLIIISYLQSAINSACVPMMLSIHIQMPFWVAVVSFPGPHSFSIFHAE